MKKQNETKIEGGSVEKAKVGELDNIAREERIRRMSKEVVGCVQAVFCKNNFLVEFEDVKNKEISSSLLVFLSSKYEGEMDEPLSHSPRKE